jgi:hypothetical protein
MCSVSTELQKLQRTYNSLFSASPRFILERTQSDEDTPDGSRTSAASAYDLVRHVTLAFPTDQLSTKGRFAPAACRIDQVTITTRKMFLAHPVTMTTTQLTDASEFHATH